MQAMVSLACVAILCGLAMGQWGVWLVTTRLQGQVGELVQDLHWARSEAATRGQNIHWSLHDGTGAQGCYVVHTGAAHACNCDTKPQEHCSNEAIALKVIQWESGQGVQISASTSSMRWSPQTGVVTPTNTIRLGTSTGAIHIVVNILGRIRTCSPDGRIPHHPAC
jgi:type IV fimbrial biogenesis protein FimT